MKMLGKISSLLVKGCFLGNAVFAANANADGRQMLASLNSNYMTVERSLLEIANAGDANAQLRMAKIYEGRQDSQGVAKWYRKSAMNGNAEAQFQLGLLYIDGELTDGDREAGMFWVEQAAQQGHYQAKVVYQSLEEEEFTIGC